MELTAGTHIDRTRAGRQFGHLPVQNPAAAAPEAHRPVPACVIQRGTGPTVVFAGGLRPGETIGQITLQRLARSLDGESVEGRVVIMPNLVVEPALRNSRPPDSNIGALSDPAHAGGGRNHIAGHQAQQLAALCVRDFLSESTLVVELGAGGNNLCYHAMCAIAQQGSDRQRAAAEAAMIAFGAPNSLRLKRLARDNLLGNTAIEAGARYLAVRIGGGGASDVADVDLAFSGCMNILISLGMLDAPHTLRATRMLRIPDERYTIISPGHGMPALLRQIGHEVYRGEPIAQLHDLDNMATEPVDVLSPVDGMLLAGFQGTAIKPGERLAVVADVVAQ